MSNCIISRKILGGNKSIVSFYTSELPAGYPYYGGSATGTDSTFFSDEYTILKNKNSTVGISKLTGNYGECALVLYDGDTCPLSSYKLYSASTAKYYGIDFYTSNSNNLEVQTQSKPLSATTAQWTIATGTNANINWGQYSQYMKFTFNTMSEIYAVTEASIPLTFSEQHTPHQNLNGINVWDIEIHGNEVVLQVMYSIDRNRASTVNAKELSITVVGKSI